MVQQQAHVHACLLTDRQQHTDGKSLLKPERSQSQAKLYALKKRTSSSFTKRIHSQQQSSQNLTKHQLFSLVHCGGVGVYCVHKGKSMRDRDGKSSQARQALKLFVMQRIFWDRSENNHHHRLLYYEWARSRMCAFTQKKQVTMEYDGDSLVVSFSGEDRW